MPQDMSRAFLMTLERLAFMTVLVISRMMDSIRLDSTARRIGSKSILLSSGPAAGFLGGLAPFARFISGPLVKASPSCEGAVDGLARLASQPFRDPPDALGARPAAARLASGFCDHVACDPKR